MINLHELYDIAVSRVNKGKYSEAENLLEQILRMFPDAVDAKHQLSKLSIRNKQYERAFELLSDIAGYFQDNDDFFIDLGRVYISLNDAENAITCFEKAASINPPKAEIYKFCAQAMFAKKEYLNAVNLVQKSILIDSNDSESFSILADSFFELNKVLPAIENYKQSLALESDNWKVYANLGIAHLQLNQKKEAKNFLLFANTLNPLQPAVGLPLCSLFIDNQQYEEATTLLGKLAAILPKNDQIQTLLGQNALLQGNLKMAIASFVTALSIKDDDVNIQMNLAMALKQSNKAENAILFYDKIIEKEARIPSVYFEKGKTELLLKKFDDGFDTIYNAHQLFPQFKEPFLKDIELKGKSVLLYTSLGLDELNIFLRFAIALKRRGAITIVVCPPIMTSLVRKCDFVDKTVNSGEEIPSFDFHCPLECLPFVLNISDEYFYCGNYLVPAPGGKDSWKQKFSTIEKLKVGLMWQHEFHDKPNVFHSVPLEALSPLLENEKIQFISLGTNSANAKLEEFDSKNKVINSNLENANMEERLACIACLDLLIAADSLTTQLALAAGVPTWVILSSVPSWHYGLEGGNSVWHPNAKLYRQNFNDDFSDVATQLIKDIKRLHK